jgi:hydrogenase 3 maturation protease
LALSDQLKKWLRKSRKIVVLGVGNPLRGDDAVGVEIVRQLRGRTSKRVKLLECETVPENFTSKIRKLNPTHVLIVDAAEFSKKPGTAKLLSVAKISGLAVSSHNAPLSMLADYLKHTINPKMALLGVQPKQTELGTGMSEEVKKTSKETVKMLEKLLRNHSG